MVWGPPIWIYLWLAGMAGGAYFAAYLVNRFSRGTQEPLLRMATYLAVPTAMIGVLLLIVDLGKPLRFWRLLTEFDNIGSAMWLGTWFLLAFVASAVIMIILWNGARYVVTKEARLSLARIADIISGIGALFAVLVIAYTGVLLASSNQPLWSATYLVPALFVTSAVSTGIAFVIVTALVGDSRAVSSRLISRLAEADALVILIELVMLVVYAVWLGASHMEGAAQGLRLLVAGSMAPTFWVGVVALAILIPLILDISNWGKEIRQRGSATWLAIMTSSVAVMIGGLLLRFAVVRGGQLVV